MCGGTGECVVGGGDSVCVRWEGGTVEHVVGESNRCVGGGDR